MPTPPTSSVEAAQLAQEQHSLDQHTPPQQDTFDDIQHDMPDMTHDLPQPILISPQTIPTLSPSLSMPQPIPANVMEHPPDAYHHRMQAHIRNLREFCDGLEYQLQFNDYRMLDVLEQEGGSFLALVADCLSKEGRLVPTEQPMVVSQADMEHHPPQMMPDHSRGVPVMTDMQLQSPYGMNPGINPNALGC